MAIVRFLAVSFTIFLLCGAASPPQSVPAQSALVSRQEQNENTWPEDIQCYSIPYGAVGFINHCITYWQVFWQFKLRSPFWPFRRLSEGPEWVLWINRGIAAVQGIVTLSIAAVTLSRCTRRWQLILVATWKMMFALEVSLWSMRASMASAREERKFHEKDGRLLLWAFGIAYCAVCLIGLVGICAIEASVPYGGTKLETVSTVFGCVGAAVIVVAIFYYYRKEKQKDPDRPDFFEHANRADYRQSQRIRGGQSFAENLCCAFAEMGTVAGDTAEPHIFAALQGAAVTTFPIIMFIFALYSDWILGIVANDIMGIPPDKAAALYWTYFVFKRLTLFQF